ncbi:MAG: P-II family nitrogen regulator [Neoaquamicrobium sediminum]|uniref:P-II family nitrogen regulator n=1 Tax=Neoaquamicrobium sediminum TaxID=1849104 RepID=UPI004035213D
MTAMIERIRIEVLYDAPLRDTVVGIVSGAGAKGYTLFNASGGMGRGGRWQEDQVTGADTKALLLTIVSPEIADAIVEALHPLLETHGLLILKSAIEVVRHDKF